MLCRGTFSCYTSLPHRITTTTAKVINNLQLSLTPSKLSKYISKNLHRLCRSPPLRPPRPRDRNALLLDKNEADKSERSLDPSGLCP
jgi:hypothetical protein